MFNMNASYQYLIDACLYIKTMTYDLIRAPSPVLAHLSVMRDAERGRQKWIIAFPEPQCSWPAPMIT